MFSSSSFPVKQTSETKREVEDRRNQIRQCKQWKQKCWKSAGWRWKIWKKNLEECVIETQLRVSLKDKFNFRKVAARWVSKELSEDPKRQCVECAEVLCYSDEEGDDFLDSVVTEKGTRAHHYTPERKQ